AGVPYVNNDGLLDFCRLHDIMIQAWSPTAGGNVFAANADTEDDEGGLAGQIRKMAQDYDTTEDAIALAWLLRHPIGIQPILGTLKEERIRLSVPADEITLSRKEWYTLLEAARGEAVP